MGLRSYGARQIFDRLKKLTKINTPCSNIPALILADFNKNMTQICTPNSLLGPPPLSNITPLSNKPPLQGKNGNKPPSFSTLSVLALYDKPPSQAPGLFLLGPMKWA